MKTTGINIEEFIKNHKHTNYFEAIMYSDGTLEYAIPSHTMKLCEIYDDTKSMKEINNMMSVDASPIDWLMYHTKCISVWSNAFMINFQFQVVTDKQKESLIILYEKGLLDFNPDTMIDIFTNDHNIFQSNLNNYDTSLKEILTKRIQVIENK